MRKGLPFVRLLAPLIFGICLGESISHQISEEILLTGMGGFFLLIFCFTKTGFYRFRALFGLCVFLFLTLTGVFITQRNKPKPSSPDTPQFIGGTVISTPKTGPKTIRFVFDGTAGRPDKKSLPGKNLAADTGFFREKMMVYIRLDSFSKQIRAGDYLVFRATPRLIVPGANPYEFDYPSYYRSMGICRQIFVSKENWKTATPGVSEDRTHGTGVRKARIKAQNYWERLFRRAGLQGESLAVASALTLGITEGLDAEIRQSYTASGASHLLSVSGLHTGIVAAVLMTLLGFMKRMRRWSWLREIMVIAGIWAYAWLTGFSSPVNRSALMFSLFIAGKRASPDHDAIHTVAVSAFFLLILKPFNLFDIGFQLSYAAVSAIILLHAPICGLIPVKNRFLRKIRDLCVVSVTAQLGTLPLCLAYFHQFPVYFLLTNLVVVPLTGLIVWGSVVLWMTSPVTFLFTPAATLFRTLMHILNGFVREVESWPGSVLENINFSAPDGLFYLILFCCLLGGMIEKKRRMLIGVLMTATVWSGFNRAEAYVHRKREVLLVYRSGEKTLVQWIRGRNQTVFYDPGESLASREKTIQRARWALKVESTTWVSGNDTSLWKNYGIPKNFNLGKRMASLRTGVFYNPDSQNAGSDGILSHRSTPRSRDAVPR